MGYVPSHPCFSASPLLSSHHVLLKGSALSSAGRTRLQTCRGCRDGGPHLPGLWLHGGRIRRRRQQHTPHLPPCAWSALSIWQFLRRPRPSASHTLPLPHFCFPGLRQDDTCGSRICRTVLAAPRLRHCVIPWCNGCGDAWLGTPHHAHGPGDAAQADGHVQLRWQGMVRGG